MTTKNPNPVLTDLDVHGHIGPVVKDARHRTLHSDEQDAGAYHTKLLMTRNYDKRTASKLRQQDGGTSLSLHPFVDQVMKP